MTSVSMHEIFNNWIKAQPWNSFFPAYCRYCGIILEDVTKLECNVCNALAECETQRLSSIEHYSLGLPTYAQIHS